MWAFCLETKWTARPRLPQTCSFARETNQRDSVKETARAPNTVWFFMWIPSSTSEGRWLVFFWCKVFCLLSKSTFLRACTSGIGNFAIMTSWTSFLRGISNTDSGSFVCVRGGGVGNFSTVFCNFNGFAWSDERSWSRGQIDPGAFLRGCAFSSTLGPLSDNGPWRGVVGVAIFGAGTGGEFVRSITILGTGLGWGEVNKEEPIPP